VKEGEEYRLRAGDEVALSVLPQKEYDTTAVVLPDGLLRVKNVGSIPAVGKTLAEIEKAVTAILIKELVNPQVSITPVRLADEDEEEPVKLGKITIVGAVTTPGPLELSPEEPLRVRKALDLAGGTRDGADLTRVLILHKDLTASVVDLSTAERVKDPAHNKILQDGDSVEVRALPVVEKVVPMVSISGFVLNPDQYELKPAMTLEQLISAAGKLSPLADVENVNVRRKGQPDRVVNLVAQREMGPNGQIVLQPGDEVFIPQQKDTVALVGAVNNAGRRALKPGLSLRDFLLESPDSATVFDKSKVDTGDFRVIRGGKQEIKVNVKSILADAKHKDNVTLQAGDIIYAPPAKGPKQGLNNILQSIPFVGALFGLF